MYEYRLNNQHDCCLFEWLKNALIWNSTSQELRKQKKRLLYTFADPGGRYDMMHSGAPVNYWSQIITKQSTPADEMYSAICIKWVGDHFDQDLM